MIGWARREEEPIRELKRLLAPERFTPLTWAGPVDWSADSRSRWQDRQRPYQPQPQRKQAYDSARPRCATAPSCPCITTTLARRNWPSRQTLSVPDRAFRGSEEGHAR